ncbi:hypothetical protein Tco_1106594 [Tanacetum coccineum]
MGGIGGSKAEAIFWLYIRPNWGSKRRTIDQSVGGKLRDRNAKESWVLLEDLTLYDNESWNDLKDFAKPVKAVSLPQDVPSTSDRRLIEIENQVQRLMEAHLAPMQPTQVNKITTACEICNGPHDTQYCMEDPKQAFVEYASSHTDEAGEGLVSNFMASQDARLSKFEADFKQQQSEMTKKIATVLKAITDRMAGALPSDTVKNPKLNVNSTTSVLNSRDSEAKEEEREREGDPKNTNTIAYNEEQKYMPQLERKDITAVDNLGPNRDDDGIEWLDVKEPLDLVDTSEESVYESLIKEMPKCSHNYDFKIKKVDPRNLKIPCMIGKMDTSIEEEISIKEITFKTPYKDPNRSELSSDGHDLLPSRVILSEDDYDRGCRKPPDLEDGFHGDTIKLGPEYVTGMDDEGEIT